jgi:dipeptidyl aminopeptidase/acylaminoacyl peptidase
MNKQYLIIIILVIVILTGGFVFLREKSVQKKQIVNSEKVKQSEKELDPLTIAAMRNKDYPGSDLVIEQTLSDESNYHQYIASYKSEGLKIYGLLTVPIGGSPKNGWPVIVFNHGYIPPTQYRTTERYVAYVGAFAQAGYIVFKPDYRGNGSSEGKPEGAYYSTSYVTDVLNALATMKKYKDSDPERIGMWGHSMGGNITLRSLVVRPNDIKAAVIWGGVVGTYNDLMNNWQRRVSYNPPPTEMALRNSYRANLIAKYGTPESNPEFWHSIDPNYYLSDITAPIQLDVGAEDEEVPPAFSQDLFDRLKKLKKTVEFYSYPGGDHNISDPNFSLAMKRSVDFFEKYLKN